MIRRLVDAHYARNKDKPNTDQVCFWLRESRTPEVLIAVASTYPDLRDQMMSDRPLLVETLTASKTALRQNLLQEEAAEKETDEAYWRPLKRELEFLKRSRRKKEP